MAGKSASYTLSVVLRLTDRLSGKIDKSLSALKALEKQSNKTLKALSALSKAKSPQFPAAPKKAAPDLLPKPPRAPKTGAREYAEASRVLGLKRQETALEREQTRLAREQAKLATDAASLSLRLQREETRLEQDAARARQASARASNTAELGDLRIQRERIRLQREADSYNRYRRDGGVLGRVDRFGRRADELRNATGDFRSAYGTVSEFARPAIEQIRTEARYRVMGHPAQQTSAGLTAVEQTLKNVRGVNRAEALESLTALTGVFGDIEQATMFLPITARYMANMKALYGDRYSPAELGRQVQNNFKSMELLGVDRPTGPGGTFTNEDRARMENYFDLFARAQATTGGDINPAEIKAFTKYARMSALGITPEGMVKLTPLISQMGGAQLGTALMTLSQNLAGGQMPAYKIREWDRYGMVRHKDEKGQPLVEYTKDGQIKRMRPGAIPLADLALKDPVAASDELAKILKSRGVDTSDFKETNKALYGLFANRTSSGVMSQMINFREALRKESGNFERALNINDTYKMLYEGQSPLAAYLDLQAKGVDAQARAAMDLVNKTGGIAGGVADWMGQHPEMAATLSGLQMLATASLEAAGGLGSLVSVLPAGGGHGGGSGASGLLGSGISFTDAAAGGWMGYRGLRFLPRLGLPGMVAAAGAGSVYILHEQYEAGKKERADAAQTGASQLEKIKALRDQHGGKLPPEVARVLASETFPGLNRASLLYSLEPKVQTAGYPGVSVGPTREKMQGTVAGEFSRRAPQLQFPEIMAGWISDTNRLVESRVITKGAGAQQLEIAKLAFPESYKTASDDLAAQTAALAASLAKANEGIAGNPFLTNNPLAQLFDGTAFQQAGEGARLLAEQSKAAGDGLTDAARASDRLPASLYRFEGSLNAVAARLYNLDFDIKIPSFDISRPTPSHNPPASPSPRPPFARSIPKSAIGSVIESDGLVNLHRGNVVTPAKLSRRKPGDWLDAATTMTRALDADRRVAQLTRETGAPAFGGSYGEFYESSESSITVSPVYQIKVEAGPGSDTDVIVAKLHAEMERSNAQLLDEVQRLTHPRRINRHVKGRMSRESEVS
jgi:hypothetical protein